MTAKTDTKTPIDMTAFLAWAAEFPRKFEADDIYATPRLYNAGYEYARSWRDDPKASVNPFMMDMKSAVLRGMALTNGQVKGVLNVARAQARFRSRPSAPVAPARSETFHTDGRSAVAAGAARAQQAKLDAIRAERAAFVRAETDRLHGGIPDIDVRMEAERDAERAWDREVARRERETEERGFRSDPDFRSPAPVAPVAPRFDADLPDLFVDALPALATYTVVFDEASDDRLTVRFSEPTWGGDDLKGAVQVSYLFGPENETDYKGVAFVRDGELRFWKRFKSESSEETRARIIAAICVISRSDDQASFREAYALRSSRCARCGRKLTVPASIHRGVGPECARQMEG